MGARKMRIRGLMDERPRLSYKSIAEKLGLSVVTVARWMQYEPSDAQAETIEKAIMLIRKGE